MTNVFRGTGFNDIILSNTSDDIVEAESGNDLIIGSLGQDLIHGGEGFDTISFGPLSIPIMLNAFGIISSRKNAISCQLDSIERIVASASPYDLIDASLADTASAYVEINLRTGKLFVSRVNQAFMIDGFENIIATGQHDLVFGNFSDNLFELRAGDDFGGGGMGDDTIIGGDGNDSLFGGMGEDILVGGQGVDFLKGGLGIDTFVFATTKDSMAGGKSDKITDFQLNELIDLSMIDPFGATAENEAFTWLGLVQSESSATQAGTAGYLQGRTSITLFATVAAPEGASQVLEVCIAGTSSISAFDLLL